MGLSPSGPFGLWRAIDAHLDTFQQVHDERFAAKYGFWRPVVERSVTPYLKCGDLHEGFARGRCPDCQHEMLVAFSSKQRCACPSCRQKGALVTAIHVAEGVCFPVAHRQVMFTIPNCLRVRTRFDRKLLRKFCACVRADQRPRLERTIPLLLSCVTRRLIYSNRVLAAFPFSSFIV